VATAGDPFGLYSDNMGTDPVGGILQTNSSGVLSYSVRTNMGNKPVNYVSWFDAARFTNWMCNGQGSSSTESGAYTIVGGVASAAHSPTAQFWLPTLDEWYKGAYYDSAKSGGAGYWAYPTRSDVQPATALAGPTGNISNSGTNVANYSSGAVWNGQPNVTTVGSGGILSASGYGTYDQGGNVFEWNEALNISLSRGLAGGGFDSGSNYMSATGAIFFDPNSDSNDYGFRLAVSVPEPSVGALLLLGGIALLWRRRAAAP
jgi:formylglycine-generating enzyme required for sulfatase activity